MLTRNVTKHIPCFQIWVSLCLPATMRAPHCCGAGTSWHIQKESLGLVNGSNYINKLLNHYLSSNNVLNITSKLLTITGIAARCLNYLNSSTVLYIIWRAVKTYILPTLATKSLKFQEQQLIAKYYLLFRYFLSSRKVRNITWAAINVKYTPSKFPSANTWAAVMC